jgi:hypothetical protein
MHISFLRMINDEAFVVGLLNWLADTLNSQEHGSGEFTKFSGVCCENFKS